MSTFAKTDKNSASPVQEQDEAFLKKFLDIFIKERTVILFSGFYNRTKKNVPRGRTREQLLLSTLAELISECLGMKFCI